MNEQLYDVSSPTSSSFVERGFHPVGSLQELMNHPEMIAFYNRYINGPLKVLLGFYIFPILVV